MSAQGALGRRTLIRAGSLLGAGAVLSACAPESTPATTSSKPAASGGGGRRSSRTLLVYFSRPGENYSYGDREWIDIGHTERVAGFIEDELSCETHRIHAADPYPEEYDPTVARNSREAEADARPQIAGELPDLADYDTLILGSPVWGSQAPMIMRTFIESVDLTGLSLYPFVTYAVSGLSGVDDDYAQALPGTTVGEGLAIQGEESAEAAPAVREWLTSSGF
ncbi:flavodoxin [Brevibacterium sp. FAM 25378]|uniref:flavodoxin n=1 Tax=unclassified Brevibacterium TaxID=2614124 RepID=UPI001F0EC3B7|nr:flavodoxin [Brevibacterium sp. S22]